jgi:hypothetical protein
MIVPKFAKIRHLGVWPQHTNPDATPWLVENVAAP